jgi:hypothetical protein
VRLRPERQDIVGIRGCRQRDCTAVQDKRDPCHFLARCFGRCLFRKRMPALEPVAQTPL